MTEGELLDLFERKVRRYLSELDKLCLYEDRSEFGLATNEYFDAAQNLGADLLLRMVEALRERPSLLSQIDNLRAEVEAAELAASAKN